MKESNEKAAEKSTSPDERNKVTIMTILLKGEVEINELTELDLLVFVCHQGRENSLDCKRSEAA